MKRILIVDDEKTVVGALKEGFKRYEKKLFQTDVAYNAEDAIKSIKTTAYELVVSDIRLPKKSGVDILMELKKLQPEAGFIAMTAFSSPEVQLQVSQLGGLKYLEKPFSFDVLEDLVLRFIRRDVKQGVSGTVESLELTSILQLINMEGKSAVLWVELDGKKGYFAFTKGEIVDAKFNDLTGIEAAKYLIDRNEGEIRIDSKRQAKKRTISIPFMNLLLDTMKEKDEKGRKEPQKAVKRTSAKKEKKKQQFDVSALKKKLSQELEILSDVKGFANAAAFGPEGKCFFEMSSDKASSLKKIGASFVSLFKKASNAISGVDFGTVEMVQVDSVKGILFAKGVHLDSFQIGLLVYIGLNGNLAMAKKGLADAVSALERKTKG